MRVHTTPPPVRLETKKLGELAETKATSALPAVTFAGRLRVSTVLSLLPVLPVTCWTGPAPAQLGAATAGGAGAGTSSPSAGSSATRESQLSAGTRAATREARPEATPRPAARHVGRRHRQASRRPPGCSGPVTAHPPLCHTIMRCVFAGFGLAQDPRPPLLHQCRSAASPLSRHRRPSYASSGRALSGSATCATAWHASKAPAPPANRSRPAHRTISAGDAPGCYLLVLTAPTSSPPYIRAERSTVRARARWLAGNGLRALFSSPAAYPSPRPGVTVGAQEQGRHPGTIPP